MNAAAPETPREADTRPRRMAMRLAIGLLVIGLTACVGGLITVGIALVRAHQGVAAASTSEEGTRIAQQTTEALAYGQPVLLFGIAVSIVAVVALVGLQLSVLFRRE